MRALIRLNLAKCKQNLQIKKEYETHWRDGAPSVLALHGHHFANSIFATTAASGATCVQRPKKYTAVSVLSYILWILL